MSTSPHRIFVSHSHKDNDFGTRLVQDLRRVLGDENAVWYDALGGLRGGDTWWEKIVEELMARNVFLIVLSPEAMNSQWVRREFNMALNEGKLIIPLLHLNCTIRADLKTIQNISFLPPITFESAFKELLLALRLPTEDDVQLKKVTKPLDDPGVGLVRQIEIAFAGQDWLEVIRKADYLMKHTPSAASSSTYRMKGLALLEEGRVQQAQEALESALALVSNPPQRLTLLSDCTSLLVKQEQWAEVLLYAKEALRMIPNDPSWLAMEQQAQAELQREALIPPKTEKLVQDRSQETLATPQETNDQSIRAYPKDAKTYYSIGLLELNIGGYKEAIANFDRAIELDPKFVAANTYSLRGFAYGYIKEYEKGFADFDRALELDPQFAPAYCNRGSVYQDLKVYDKAITDYNQAIELDPKYADAYYKRGRIYRLLREYEKAIADFGNVIKFCGNDTFLAIRLCETYNIRGEIYCLLREYEKTVSSHLPSISSAVSCVYSYIWDLASKLGEIRTHFPLKTWYERQKISPLRSEPSVSIVQMT